MRSVEDQSKASAEPRADVKSEVARTLIEAMEKGNTPWQKPWAAEALRPTNLATSNGYRGVNRLLLALSAKLDSEGRADPRWATYQQAQANGWQVRRGEKGTPIVKLVELAMGSEAAVDAKALGGKSGALAGGGAAADGSSQGQDRGRERKAFALRRYVVFNAQQMDGAPELATAAERTFEPVVRAEAVIQALKDQTGLRIVHGGDHACYVPALDEIRLPPKKAFNSTHDLWSTILHEAAHSTLHEKRMARREAIAKRWGDEAYALEELRAEICSAILSAETGVPTSQAHIDNHAAYLRSWIKAIESDPMAIFSAAKDADLMAQYLLGLERQMVALDAPEEWVADYDRHM